MAVVTAVQKEQQRKLPFRRERADAVKRILHRSRRQNSILILANRLVKEWKAQDCTNGTGVSHFLLKAVSVSQEDQFAPPVWREPLVLPNGLDPSLVPY